ncbi:MAG: type II toxin-antitoxin system PemK/MazF family toxin [Lactobacillales bacterium]|jgi:mRNA interferase MazF|nr:type II toxin-antitoxin system PemK/MazF family toxin [Lactobacillales bacterium]
MVNYIPRQRDIVTLDFDTSRGNEIKKRRPAVVVSSLGFNRSTGFCVCCPITSTKKKHPTNVEISDVSNRISGSILTSQLKSFDYKARGIAYVETLNVCQWAEVKKKIELIFE